MRKEALALLLGYLEYQKKEIDRLWVEIKGTEPSEKEKTVYLAYSLHNLYCALEDLFKEVAKTFENLIEDPARYHRDLLKRMILEIPYIRPRLLSNDSYKMLDELRSFRHTFRHAYAYELDPKKIADLRKVLLSGWNKIESDITNYLTYIKETFARGSMYKR